MTVWLEDDRRYEVRINRNLSRVDVITKPHWNRGTYGLAHSVNYAVGVAEKMGFLDVDHQIACHEASEEAFMLLYGIHPLLNLIRDKKESNAAPKRTRIGAFTVIKKR